MIRPEIQRALAFVANNLDRPITVAEVANAAHLSEFHLHRVFHTSVGESVGRFITRRRLEHAALRLAYEPAASITEIALSSGYSSSSNFSKAFTAFFGCSPSRVRSPNTETPATVGKLTEQYGKHFRSQDLFSYVPELQPEEVRREVERWNKLVRITEVDVLHFACLASPGGYDFTTLERTWAELISRAEQLGLVEEDVDAWGIPHDSPSLTASDRCRYHACVPCPENTPLPAPLFAGIRPAGRYAVFRYQGAVSGVEDAYRSIFSCWFRESSLALEDFVPMDHYVGDHPKDGQCDVEFWLRVRTAV